MQNKHIEHIEDTILTGDLSTIQTLFNPHHVSVKIDGSPAIVWGTNPSTKTFFVGTKAVFNKKKIRIAHSHDEIDLHYEGEVAQILHACFDNLPRTDSIYQGDFIGFGGSNQYEPNLISYEFGEIITQNIIIAPHTFYCGGNDLRDVIAFPILQMFDDTENVKWVQPSVDRICGKQSAPSINVQNVKFLSQKDAVERKKSINFCIREGIPLTDETLNSILGCQYLTNLYQMVIEMKEEFIDSLIIHDSPTAYINGLKVKQEGFIISDECGQMTKLVDREVFSSANFNQIKKWAS